MDHINLELFLDKILEGYETDYDKVYKLLTSRGFLLDIIDGEIIVSDNSHELDVVCLNDILEQSKIGFVKDNKVIFSEKYNWNNLLFLFDKVNKVSDEVCRNLRLDCWGYFKSRGCGYKVEAIKYEPYISKYLKATSSIGITTDHSCDAHHKKLNKSIKIRFVSRFDQYWHKLLHEAIFRFGDNPNFKWTYDTTSSEPVWCVKNLSRDLDLLTLDYVSLINMGDYIYNNRIELRRLKSDLIKELSGKINKNTPDSEAFKMMHEAFQRIKNSYSLGIEHSV